MSHIPTEQRQTNELTRADIEPLAYRLWQEGGQKEGTEEENWHLAVVMLSQQRGFTPEEGQAQIESHDGGQQKGSIEQQRGTGVFVNEDDKKEFESERGEKPKETPVEEIPKDDRNDAQHENK